MVDSKEIPYYLLIAVGFVPILAAARPETPERLRLPLVVGGLGLMYGSAVLMYLFVDGQLLFSDEQRDERTLRIEALSSRNAWLVEMVLLSSLALMVLLVPLTLPLGDTLIGLVFVGFAVFYGSKSWYGRRM